jgi:hypothetical protein
MECGVSERRLHFSRHSAGEIARNERGAPHSSLTPHSKLCRCSFETASSVNGSCYVIPHSVQDSQEEPLIDVGSFAAGWVAFPGDSTSPAARATARQAGTAAARRTSDRRRGGPERELWPASAHRPYQQWLR